jgi:hypothetical protein
MRQENPLKWVSGFSKVDETVSVTLVNGRIGSRFRAGAMIAGITFLRRGFFHGGCCPHRMQRIIERER